jgi:subfamily B ATP-binding cassette protein MsbA
MLVAVLTRGIGDLLGEFFLSRISFQVIHQLRTELFERLLDLPNKYFDGTTSAKLISRITFNVAQLKDTATEALKTIIQDGAKVIAFLGMLLYINWKLTLIFLVIAPLVGLIVGVASKRFRKISERVQTSMSDLTHVISEAVNAFRVIRIFGGANSERSRFRSTSNTNRAQNLKMVVTKSVSTQLIQLLVAMALSLLVVLLFRDDVRGDMDAGEIVQYLTLAGFLARPLKKLSAVNARLQKGLAAAVDVFAQLDEDAEPDLGTHETKRVEGHIEFRDVSFAYTNERDPVLHNVSFEINPGQTVAIVGQS